MDHKYISTENFEIIENPNFFEVDEEIAETISILNKKGYKTRYCCAGHIEDDCYKVKLPIYLLDEVKSKNMSRIAKIEKNFFWYYGGNRAGTGVYISFIEHYNFKSLPNGFMYETADEFREKVKNYPISEEDKKELVYGDRVSKIIDYIENNKRIDEEIVETQIKESNEILLNWAKSLPDNN